MAFRDRSEVERRELFDDYRERGGEREYEEWLRKCESFDRAWEKGHRFRDLAFEELGRDREFDAAKETYFKNDLGKRYHDVFDVERRRVYEFKTGWTSGELGLAQLAKDQYAIEDDLTPVWVVRHGFKMDPAVRERAERMAREQPDDFQFVDLSDPVSVEAHRERFPEETAALLRTAERYDQEFPEPQTLAPEAARGAPRPTASGSKRPLRKGAPGDSGAERPKERKRLPTGEEIARFHRVAAGTVTGAFQGASASKLLPHPVAKGAAVVLGAVVGLTRGFADESDRARAQGSVTPASTIAKSVEPPEVGSEPAEPSGPKLSERYRYRFEGEVGSERDGPGLR